MPKNKFKKVWGQALEQNIRNQLACVNKRLEEVKQELMSEQLKFALLSLPPVKKKE